MSIRNKAEFESLKNDIAKVTPAWASNYYTISIECKNYSKSIVAPKAVTNKNLTENYGGV